LATLEGAGALSDFVELQKQLTRAQEELAQLRRDYSTALTLESGKARLEFERKEVELRIREDHEARSDRLEHAALIVRELVRELYDDRNGNLVVKVTTNGPEFSIKIDGDDSQGISHMELWCFDMFLARLCSERGLSPGFLVHDSHAFDGVDERQVASALRIGLEYSKKYKFQYVVTMNSDIFDRLGLDATVRESVIATRLSDKRADGGLFGTVIDMSPFQAEPEEPNELDELEDPTMDLFGEFD
jgi:uncharacterized protein YydD (DUF2326 family)